MLQIAGTVTGDGKTYTIFFRADQLAAKQQKYQAKGAVLTISGQVTLPPNPNPEPRPARNGAVDQHLMHGSVSGKPKTKDDPRGGRRLSMMRSVVCLTTSEFFQCVTDAALAYGLQIPAVSAHINHPRQHRQVKGYQFRFATSDEAALQRMIHP